jgi:hypothetical protein
MKEKFFVDSLERIFHEEGYKTGREIGAGYGVADLVLVTLNVEKCTIRKGHNQSTPLLNEAFFRALKYIPDSDESERVDPMSLEDLVVKTGLSKSFLKYNLIRELKKNGYIKEVGDNYYFKVNGWVPIANEVIAIEAKIKDWKRGFLQTARYKSFADRVYLALPEETIKSVNLELLKSQNIGLISYDPESGRKKTLIECISSKPIFEYKRNFVSEFFWKYA